MYSKTLNDYLSYQKRYPGLVIFYQIGEFYEILFENAKTVSKILGLTLTKRRQKIGNSIEFVPMCGVPASSVRSYALKLVAHKFRVVLVEQEPQTTSTIIKRKVREIITPGTATEDEALIALEASCIMSISYESDRLFACWVDLMAGKAFLSEITNPSDLNQTIEKVAPSELLLQSPIENLEYSGQMTIFDELDGPEIISQFGLDYYKSGAKTLITLLSYIKFVGGVTSDLRLEIINDKSDQTLSSKVCKDLDFEQIREIFVREAASSFGARFLKHLMLRPLQNKERVDKRLNLVALFVNIAEEREGLHQILCEMPDIERALGRIRLNRATIADLENLAIGFRLLPVITRKLQQLQSGQLEKILANLVMPSDLEESLNRTLSFDDNRINHNASPLLDKIHKSLNEIESMRLNLERGEQSRRQIQKLRINYSSAIGFYIEIPSSASEKLPENYDYLSCRKGFCSYKIAELANLSNKKLELENQAIHARDVIVKKLMIDVRRYNVNLKSMIENLALLDGILSLAKVASQNHFTRPTIVDEVMLHVENGWHPLFTNPIKNPCKLTTKDRCYFITGANMSGKTSFLKTQMIIALLAGVGSFVPAEQAELSLVDRFFTRFGSYDNLTAGKSTFMIEMCEIAEIVNYATDNSLVMVDEIGRGTGSEEGLALAQAILEYLTSAIKPRLLFSSHYLAIAERVKNLQLMKIGTDHKIISGVSESSLGIVTAKLAGLPLAITARADEILKLIVFPNYK